MSRPGHIDRVQRALRRRSAHIISPAAQRSLESHVMYLYCTSNPYLYRPPARHARPPGRSAGHRAEPSHRRRRHGRTTAGGQAAPGSPVKTHNDHTRSCQLGAYRTIFSDSLCSICLRRASPARTGRRCPARRAALTTRRPRCGRGWPRADVPRTRPFLLQALHLNIFRARVARRGRCTAPHGVRWNGGRAHPRSFCAGATPASTY